MNHWEVLGEAKIPGGGVMQLYRRGEELSIRVDRRELMNSRVHGSEDALAAQAFQRLGARPATRVLIGGLGLGFTLAATLRGLPKDGRVVVAELVPEVVAWNQGPIGPVAGHPLADPRVTVRVADVADVLREAAAAFDVILLDVDNGPEGFTKAGNDRLYSPSGLAATRQALTPGGVVGWWSAFPSPTFGAQLGRAGFVFDEVRVRERGDKGARHTLWFATPTGARARRR